MALEDGRFVVDASASWGPAMATHQALEVVPILLKAGDLERAERILVQVVQDDCLSGEAWFFLGVIGQRLKRPAEAVHHYEKALRLRPDLAGAHNNLGVVLQELGRISEAEKRFREALRLMPDYPEAHNSLGNILQAQGRFDEAVDAYRQALMFRPLYVNARKNLGHALHALGRTTEAVACFEEGLRHAPDNALLHVSRALVRLQQGDFPRGWPEFEWRRKGPNQPVHNLPQPVWDGGELAGCSILIIAEQGLGDTIQFIRFAPMVAHRGGRVVLICVRALGQLLATCPGVDEVVVEGNPLPRIDCYVQVMSLPAILGTTLHSIPCQVPYLAADPALEARWRDALRGIKELKIGVVWQGDPNHTKDRERSFRLAHLEPVARLPGVRLFSLQKKFGLEQIQEVSDRFVVTDLGAQLEDLAHTASVMRNLDLVISADTCPAHLAGALGVPVWIPLPFICDWRWMTDRDDSPWYPTMRLFRQRRFGDWDAVFTRLACELDAAHSLLSRARSTGES
jgi:Tfp pilus assembly protein PilF